LQSGPPVATVTALGFRIQLCRAFHVRAGQVIQQHIELHIEQSLPAPLQMLEQFLPVRQYPVQTAVQPILFRYRKIHAQQHVHRALKEPLTMHAELAARIDQPVHH
jgi:hypothetical protein